jgi:tRNA A37 methylthiotransferase MiaB
MKAALVCCNDDGFSLGVEFLKAVVGERVGAARIEHQVWHQGSYGSLESDYLGHFNRYMAKLFEFQPDVLGFSTFVWNYHEITTMAEIAKRFLPRTTVVVGGPEASSRKSASRILNQCRNIDYVIRGEAEETYPAFLTALLEDRDIDTVPGVTLRRMGEISHNPDAAAVNLRDIPYVFTEANHDLKFRLETRPTATYAYETGRGCRQKCRFCLYGVPALRAFDLDRVERELAFLLARQIKVMRICDAHFGISKKRSMALFEILAAHNRGTSIHIYPDTMHVDEDYVRAMNKAGCRVVSLGIQSTDPESLALSSRRFNPETFRNAVRLIREGHFQQLAADVILGLPGDNYSKVRESVRFAFDTGIQHIHFAPLMGFPGTAFYERSEEFQMEMLDVIPPIVVESIGSSKESYMQSMRFAATLDRVDRELPTVLAAMLLCGQDPVPWIEVLTGRFNHDAAFAGNPFVMATLHDSSSLVQDAFAWDAAALRQRRNPATLSPVELGDAVMDGELQLETAALTLRHPIHLIKSGKQTAVLARAGQYRYLFPPGGSRAYVWSSYFEALVRAAEPGESMDLIIKAASNRNPDLELKALNDAARVLIACGAISVAARQVEVCL